MSSNAVLLSFLLVFLAAGNWKKKKGYCTFISSTNDIRALKPLTQVRKWTVTGQVGGCGVILVDVITVPVLATLTETEPAPTPPLIVVASTSRVSYHVLVLVFHITFLFN